MQKNEPKDPNIAKILALYKEARERLEQLQTIPTEDAQTLVDRSQSALLHIEHCTARFFHQCVKSDSHKELIKVLELFTRMLIYGDYCEPSFGDYLQKSKSMLDTPRIPPPFNRHYPVNLLVDIRPFLQRFFPDVRDIDRFAAREIDSIIIDVKQHEEEKFTSFKAINLFNSFSPNRKPTTSGATEFNWDLLVILQKNPESELVEDKNGKKTYRTNFDNAFELMMRDCRVWFYDHANENKWGDANGFEALSTCLIITEVDYMFLLYNLGIFPAEICGLVALFVLPKGHDRKVNELVGYLLHCGEVFARKSVYKERRSAQKNNANTKPSSIKRAAIEKIYKQ